MRGTETGTRGALAWLIVVVTAAVMTSCTREADGSQSTLVEHCGESCATLGQACGTVCGVSCGTCAEDEACVAGACRCQPRCDGACGDDDGCGGVCPCPEDISCIECGLKLTKRFVRAEGGAIAQVAVAVESGTLSVAPRLAELRIAADRPLVLERVQAGDALGAAKKLLHRFASTSLPFEQTDDGVWRILIISATDAHEEIGPGRWLTLTFGQASEPVTGPVRFRIVRRAETFAPASADAALQITSYDAPLRVDPR